MSQKEDTRITLTLSYNWSDYAKLLKYDSFIRRHIAQGDRIPARVLKGFFSVLEKPALEDFELREQLMQAAFEKAAESAAKLKYKFSIKIKKQPYSFEGYLKQLAIYLEKNHNTIYDKQLFIEAASRILHRYLSAVPNHKLTTYARTIIVGITAAGFGHLRSEKEQKKSPSYTRYTEYLHDSTKYIYKKTSAKQITGKNP